MVFSHDGSSSRGSKRVVPLDKARDIARQRDTLAEKLETLQREHEQLAETRKAAEHRIDELEAQLKEAECEIQRLRETADAPPASSPNNISSPVEESPSPDEVPNAEEVERLERRVAELTSDLQRVRSQSEEAADEARREERVHLLSGLGDVLDSVERGLGMDMGPSAREGLKAIRAQLVRFFRREGADVVGEVGAPLDPHRHEAIARMDSSDVEPGHIAEVDRHGLVLEDGTIVRPARVVVAS